MRSDRIPRRMADRMASIWGCTHVGITARIAAAPVFQFARIDDFGTGAQFVAAPGEAGDALGHHPRVSIGKGDVDSSWSATPPCTATTRASNTLFKGVTQHDVDLARRISEIAADHKVVADPASVSDIELGLDTARPATIASVWAAALLTGSVETQGRGTPTTRSGMPPDGCRTCGSGTPMSTRFRVSGSTSRY